MYLNLPHQTLDIFTVSRAFVVSCYALTKSFPPEERFGITRQIKRAATSVFLNIAEGCSRKSIAERKRFYEIARGSIVEVDAAIDIAATLGFCKDPHSAKTGELLVRCFQLISKMINK